MTTTKVLEDARFKATAVSAKTRTLDFYAATFSDTPDKNGDTIDPHAFDKWLGEFYKAGKPLPISFAHSAVLDSTDPFAIIGSAPADPTHVFTDSFGLRVKASLNVGGNSTASYVADLIDQGIISAASIAFVIPPGGDVKQKDGSFKIMQVMVKEAGPCLMPANEEAVILALKTIRDELKGEPRRLDLDATGQTDVTDQLREQLQAKAVDTSAWDGNKAMGMCSTAAQYRAICAAERTIGTADERQHYALPHHYPGNSSPNEAGVKAALPRVSQTQNITDAERSSAQSHLEAHMKEINPDAAAAKAMEDAEMALKHAASPRHIQSAHDALVRAGAKCAEDSPIAKTEETTEARLRRLRFIKLSTV